MSKQKYIDDVIKILYQAQIDNKVKCGDNFQFWVFPNEKMNKLDQKLGVDIMLEIYYELSRLGFTNLKASKGQNGIHLSLINQPFLNYKGIQRAQYLLNPVWQKYILYRFKK